MESKYDRRMMLNDELLPAGDAITTTQWNESVIKFHLRYGEYENPTGIQTLTLQERFVAIDDPGFWEMLGDNTAGWIRFKNLIIGPWRTIAQVKA